MKWINTLRTSDLRGFSKMMRTAAIDLTDVIEGLHAILGGPMGAAHPEKAGRTRGITGAVYGAIREVTHGLGWGVDNALAIAERRAIPPETSPEREALLAVLNGVWGDQLAAERNPLAIPMTLRSAGRTLHLDPAALRESFPLANGRMLLLVHGLCMNDLQWSHLGHNHGLALGGAFDYTPLYLHYNSGQHVSSNGRAFAALLGNLVAAWPQPVEEIVIVAHSMGGLVTRSACFYGDEEGAPWLHLVRKVFCLGTPHHGSPVERGGNMLDVSLGALPITAPFQRLGQRRSAGITDLRYGSLVDEDWHGIHRFHPLPDNRLPVPLMAGIQWYAMAATRGTPKGSLTSRVLGDGLVTLDSALGRHRNPARTLNFAPEHQWIGHSLKHNELLWNPAVCDQIGRWMADN